MESQTLRLLRQRRSELERRHVELQAMLEPVKRELAQVDIAIRALTPDAAVAIPPLGADGSAAAVAHFRRRENPDVQKMTFKQLVVKALSEHFENGATANELLDFFKSNWCREIMRTSLSPQLSRLKNDNLIELHGKVWHLSRVVKAFGTPGLFPDENGEAEASPDTDEAPTSSDREPSSAEHPTQGGSALGEEETT